MEKLKNYTLGFSLVYFKINLTDLVYVIYNYIVIYNYSIFIREAKMSKTYPITVRLTEEQKLFIDRKIVEIKQKVDIDVPPGMIIRKCIDKIIKFSELKDKFKELGFTEFLHHKLCDKSESMTPEKIEQIKAFIDAYNLEES